MRTATAATRGTTAYNLEDDRALVPDALASSRRTQVTSVEPDWLSDVVSDWDAVFGETSTTATRAVDSGRRVLTCLYGDRPTSIAWKGRQNLVLDDLTIYTMNWDVVVSRAASSLIQAGIDVVGDDPDGRPAVITIGGTLSHSALGLQDAPSLEELAARSSAPSDSDGSMGSEPTIPDVIEAVQMVSSHLGVTERDVLAAAGIRDRTYYYWKQHPGTAIRAGSQANLWGVVSSVAGIVAQLDRYAARWLRADPTRFQLFLDGQHARLALLAAAAASDVRIPSDTLDARLDAHGVGVATDARDDDITDDSERARIEKLKLFRTRQPVRFTHDEDGSPLPQPAGLSATFYADEPEDELVLIDLNGDGDGDGDVDVD